MRELNESRLASALMIVLGAWLLVSPAFISITGAALASLLITGAVVVLTGLVQLFWKNSVPSWVTALAAAWLLVSAFTFSVSNAVVWNQVIAAVVGFMLAIWDGVEIGDYQAKHHVGMG